MSQTRRLCVKSSRVAQEWADTGALLFGHRNVSDNMSWQAGIPTEQDRQDEEALSVGSALTASAFVPSRGRAAVTDVLRDHVEEATP